MEDVTSPTGKPRRRPAKSAPAAEAVAADEPAAPKKRTRAAKAGTTVVTAQANNGTSGTPDRPGKAPRKRQPKKQEPDDLITELDRVLADLDPTPAPDEEDRAKAPLWAMIVADPGFTSEHVAREAVRRVGADARDWVAWVRGRYPGAGADAAPTWSRTGIFRLRPDRSCGSCRQLFELQAFSFPPRCLLFAAAALQVISCMFLHTSVSTPIPRYH